MAKKAEGNTDLFVATTAAVASILANVTQAIESGKLKKDVGRLRTDREILTRTLRRLWQSYESQRSDLAAAQVDLAKARAIESDLRCEVGSKDRYIKELSAARDRASAECTNKDVEVSKLRKRIAELEGKLEGRSHHA